LWGCHHHHDGSSFLQRTSSQHRSLAGPPQLAWGSYCTTSSLGAAGLDVGVFVSPFVCLRLGIGQSLCVICLAFAFSRHASIWWNDQCGEGMRKLHEDLPATTTWEAEFLLREGLSREVMGKWMANEAVPWKRRRRWLQTIAGIFPCGKWLYKIRKRPDDLCARCAKVGRKNVETVAHLQSVQCVSQVDAVTAAHNRCWNVIMDSEGFDIRGRHVRVSA
jgi:hypothetical protein